MHSHHSHSGQFCTHAVGDLEECILEAIRQKFELFCLTEHIPRYREDDLYPGETQSLIELMDMFENYYTLARKLQQKYVGQIEILVGLESEFIRDIDLRVLELLIAKYPIDLMVGSVHHVNAIPVDFDKATWEKALATCKNEEDFYGRYFDHQYEVLRTFKPLVIGHFDVVLLFAPQEVDLLSWSSVREKIIRNLKFVIGYGGMFELNSASFRKGWNVAYPRPNIVGLVLENGGDFCLSDDSHGPQQVGLNFHRMQEYVKSMGIQSLARLRRDEQYNKADESGEIDFVSVRTERSNELLQQFLSWPTRLDA